MARTGLSRRAPRMEPDAGMSRGMVALFTITGGLAVANIYLAQPLLTAIAREFHTGSGTVSLLVTVTTAGYAVGLVLVVPLADIVNRRRLIVILLSVVAAMQAAAAAAPSILLLIVTSAAMAVSAVIAPIMVAFGATLATPDQRGRVTGAVMSGVLAGVLLARTGGGLVAEWAGTWRAVPATAAGIMGLLAIALHRALPDVPVAERLGYLAALRSVAAILRAEPVLRLRCAYGFLCFAGFNVFWASSAFLLAAAPYHYSEAVIGAFGLIGMVGVIAARVTGRLVDRGFENVTTGSLLAVLLASWVIMATGAGQLIGTLLIGVILLDLAVQGVQVTNLSTVYRLRPRARSRITTAYTGIYFAGGAAGSTASGVAYAAAGWIAVCVVGAAFALLAVVVWTIQPRGRKEYS